MLFERASEVSSFNRYMLSGIANKTDQRSMLFRYPQQFVAGAVGQQSPFVNGDNGVLKLRAFLRSEQKRFDWNGAKIRNFWDVFDGRVCGLPVPIRGALAD